MSPQFLELLLFAGVTIVLVNRLFSMLGNTDKDDPSRKKSQFGEPGEPKDVTYSSTVNNESLKEVKQADLSISNEMLVEENRDRLRLAISDLLELNPSFNTAKFIKSAGSAFSIIIKALKDQDDKLLNELIDKRYIEKIPQLKDKYADYSETKQLKTKISDVSTFGNNVIIKVLFSDTNLKDEWTFQRSLLSSSPNWYLTNVETIG